MAYQARIKDTMTKKDLIEEYHRLLDLFNQEVAATKEAQDRVSELERKTDQEALDAGLATTVDSVFEGTSRLRALAGATLNDLADKMAQQAEKLERLNQAVALQEARLKGLHQIEHAADTMAKLAAAYAEEKARLEGGSLRRPTPGRPKTWSGRMRSAERNWRARSRKNAPDGRERRTRPPESANGRKPSTNTTRNAGDAWRRRSTPTARRPWRRNYAA